ILEDAKLGLFGRIRSEARVRARVRPKRPRPKEERKDRRRRDGRPRSGDRSSASGQKPRSGGVISPERPSRNDSEDDSAGTSDEHEGARMDVSMAEQGDLARQFLEG